MARNRAKTGNNHYSFRVYVPKKEELGATGNFPLGVDAGALSARIASLLAMNL